MEGYSYLTLEQRAEIERLHNAGMRAVDIASRLGRSVAAIYEELARGYTGERNSNGQRKYSAEQAQIAFCDNIARRGRRKEPKEQQEI